MTQSTMKLPTNALLDAMASKTRHVFITGASRGIGEATARLLADKNVHMTLAARSYNRLLGVCMDVGVEKSHAVKLDLVEEQSIDDAITTAESKFGPIDVLICNAGIHEDTPLSDVSAQGRARFRRVIEVNLVGTYFLAQLASLHMRPGGRIIFIGSVLSRVGAPQVNAYAASKHALMGLTRSMALELAPRNIRVNSVNPTWVDTDMARAAINRRAEKTGESVSDVAAKYIGRQPIRRMVKPLEVASYIEFLMGPGGDAITGQGIDISCGMVSP
ncbi:MAG: hypothetical protein CMH53_05060 [Myxococcales bacterium]|nr:hypothetical protein [Myxococcales bacterium]